jgi:hypothetical protein
MVRHLAPYYTINYGVNHNQSKDSAYIMTDHKSQPPFYLELFEGFSNIAIQHGTRTIEGDFMLEPGKDGTVTPQGEPAWYHKVTFNSANMPPDLIDEYSTIEVSHGDENIFGSSISPEAVHIYLDLTDKTRITYDLRRQLGHVTISLVEKILTKDTREQSIDITEEDQGKIIEELFNGDTSRLSDESPQGEFARAIYLELLEPDEATPDDINRLRKILSVLNL